MREWLSRAEWCDVRLVCRGRVFCAHRAVLASVSPYLRLLLISHSEEDTPTYIFLPDFDLDAMSCVLHYMYNGEVTLPVNSVNSFFDIITTLKIFVDPKSLDHVKDRIEHFDTKIVDLNSIDIAENGLISPVDTGSTKDLIKLEANNQYINEENTSTEEQSESCETNSQIHSQYACKRESRSLKQRLEANSENVQAQDGNQQKSSPLRDPLAEPRPLSGNANGPPPVGTVGVPAITNERYRDPGSRYTHSEPLKGLNSGRNVVESSQLPKEIENTRHILNLTNSTQFDYTDIAESFDENNMKSWKDTFGRRDKAQKHMNEVRRPNPLRPVPTLLPLSLYEKPVRQIPALLDLTALHTMPRFLHPAYRDGLLSSTLSIDSMCEDFQHNKVYGEINKHVEINNSTLNRTLFESQIKDPDVQVPPRKSAFNQVLASPWRSRVPNCYRPQPSKTRDSPPKLNVESQVQIEPVKEQSKSPSNDDNNNVRSPQSPLGEIEVQSSDSTRANSASNPHSIASIIGDDEFKCNTCDKVFSSPDRLSAHERAHAAAVRHTCAECGKSFSQLRNYKYHVSVHRGTREFAATCTVCGKYFNDRGYLSSHMKIHRNRKEYECPHCPKSFNQRVAYNMHVRIHTGVKPHVCSECGKAFSRKMLLKQHQRTHSGERPYACSVCDKRFADRSNMTLHMRLHSGVKPFACTLCSKSFTKKHHLKTHLNYHTGDKPYSCPRCQLAFSQSSNMRTHLKKCNATDTISA